MDAISNILSSLNLGESTVMWLLFVAAALRGLAATAAEWIPNDKLGGLAGIIDLIGGNNRNASGSQ
tara:strand:- start:247 stop:444 length:198 start_codon:yes stop_codon:yes gene_type:complete